MHCESILRCMLQKNQQRHHSTTAAADCNATDWSVSHYVVPSVNNLPRAMQPFAKIIWPTCLLFAIFHGTELPIKCRRAVKKLPAHCVLEQQDRALQMDGRTDRQKVAQSPQWEGCTVNLALQNKIPSGKNIQCESFCLQQHGNYLITLYLTEFFDRHLAVDSTALVLISIENVNGILTTHAKLGSFSFFALRSRLRHKFSCLVKHRITVEKCRLCKYGTW